MKLILASNSPRRKELLAGLEMDFEVRVMKGIDESYPASLPTHDIAEFIACKKAAHYEVAEDEMLVAADTIVTLDGEVFGKPATEQEACQMLRRLSGRTHQVITGVCLRTIACERHFSVCTSVTFRQLAEQEIEHYVSHYRPLDKAGAYGIQEWIGYIGVTGIEGSYFNVVGLPVQRIYDEMQLLLKTS